MELTLGPKDLADRSLKGLPDKMQALEAKYETYYWSKVL
jgi:hypothetical protein